MTYKQILKVIEEIDLEEKMFLTEESADDNNLLNLFTELEDYAESLIVKENHNIDYDFVNAFEFKENLILVDLFSERSQKSIEFLIRPNSELNSILYKNL